MFYKIKKIIFISSLFFIFSCATSQQGTEQMVSFSSIPNGATVKTSHGFSCSITPCKIKLPRNKSFEATVSKPGFTTEVVKVDSLPSGAGAVGAVGTLRRRVVCSPICAQSADEPRRSRGVYLQGSWQVYV